MTAVSAYPTKQATASELDAQFGMKTYGRMPVTFVEGKGTKLWDSNGREYLDFLSGIAVCGLGHCHPAVTKAIASQAAMLVHVSNLFHTEQQPLLASKLCERTGMDRAFFCNSGTEANEAAIKLARKWGKKHKGSLASHIVTLTGSFHGRTLGALAATAKPQYQTSFTPLPAGFTYTTRGALKALDAAVDERVCAVMLEPVQGEGGVHALPLNFIKGARKICDEKNALLIVDEVQSGLGRTGKFLAIEHAGVKPDVITLAKGIANGVPMGVCLAKGSAADVLEPGDHGCTFGGNPLACAAALAVLDTIENENLIQNALAMGSYLRLQLQGLAASNPDLVEEIRGLGLMLGIQLKKPIAKQWVGALLDQGVVVGTAGDDVIRLLPPLIVTEADCDRLVEALGEVFAKEMN